MQVDIRDITIRTFGWIQNPSDFKKLKRTVQCFDYESKLHKDLVNNRLSELILPKDGFDELHGALKRVPLILTYKELTGTTFKPRSSARCNGIVQSVVAGQGKKFTDNWTADGFIRWAHALGFIEYLYLKDAFRITKQGLDFSRSLDGGDDEENILKVALMSYPPAIRILSLLENGEHLTKFELAKKLGFSGESGFTSLPQDIFLSTLANTTNTEERNKMKSNWDGSADKYARMISRWLEKLKLLKKKPKKFNVHTEKGIVSESINHAYTITGDGLKFLRQARGGSSHKRIPKRVFWEMMCTKSTDRIYIRTRRSIILKLLMTSGRPLSVKDIMASISNEKFNDTETTILDDIEGLVNTGINIEGTNNGFILRDEVLDFTIPTVVIENHRKSNIQEQIDNLREELKVLSHDYLLLLELSVDAKQNRMFEIKTLELFIKEIKYEGLHLGGSRKPDGIIFTDESEEPYGVIIDTKAYEKGYSLPISQADEMERYVRENIDRNPEINDNEWWSIFPEIISKFYFVFISNKFVGNYKAQIERINMLTDVKGGALEVSDLLLYAEYYKRNIVTHDDFSNKINNGLINF